MKVVSVVVWTQQVSTVRPHEYVEGTTLMEQSGWHKRSLSVISPIQLSNCVKLHRSAKLKCFALTSVYVYVTLILYGAMLVRTLLLC